MQASTTLLVICILVFCLFLSILLGVVVYSQTRRDTGRQGGAVQGDTARLAGEENRSDPERSGQVRHAKLSETKCQ